MIPVLGTSKLFSGDDSFGLFCNLGTSSGSTVSLMTNALSHTESAEEHFCTKGVCPEVHYRPAFRLAQGISELGDPSIPGQIFDPPRQNSHGREDAVLNIRNSSQWATAHAPNSDHAVLLRFFVSRGLMK